MNGIIPYKGNVAQRALRAVAKGLFGIDFGAPGAPTYRTSQEWLRGSDTLRDPDTVDQPYTQVGPFQRVVSVISRDAASVAWEFFRVDASGEPGDEPVPNHPVSRVWARPNDMMLGNQLMIGSYISKLVFGEWIWYYPDLSIGRLGGLSVTSGKSMGEIVLLHPPSVTRKVENGVLKYALRRADGQEEQLDETRLTRSARYNPYDRLRGLPLSASIIADMVGYYAAARWNERFFNEQNGVPTLLLVPSQPGQLNQDDREKFLRRFLQGTGGNRRVGVIPGGWDVKDFGLSQRDMDFGELRQFGRDEILANAGVPPLIAGYLTRPITYNASEQKELYWESTISNFLTEEQAVINEDFLPKIGVIERVFPDWEKVKAMLENLNEKTEIATRWFAMGLSKKVINERLEMGWPDTEIDDYEIGYLPFNLMPSDLVSNPPPPAAPPALPPADQEADASEDDTPGSEGSTKSRSIAGGHEIQRALYWRNLVARTRDVEIRMNGAIRRHLNEIRDEVLYNVGGVKGWLRERAIEKEEGWVLVLFNLARSKAKLQASAKPLQTDALRRGGESIMSDLGLALDFNMHDPVVAARLANLSGKITGIDDRIEATLRESLLEGLKAGESPQQLATRVRHVMDVSLGRSMMIAQTEVGFAFSDGRDVGMEQAGVEYTEWLTARDARVRESHQIDGQVRRIGEKFSNGLTRPLEPGAPAEEVIRCRCAALPVLRPEE